ncbi:hypothetical protein E2C01_045537 [Portunus trituberculatus]|uniref:Uncharacterized protein n=1 Tax=Portunus trituberculatus TaxID=210409 RepID=A0A5B7G2J3_PORTR|nr:hypothetical protein [Portunus trituberculatus]
MKESVLGGICRSDKRGTEGIRQTYSGHLHYRRGSLKRQNIQVFASRRTRLYGSVNVSCQHSTGYVGLQGLYH